MAQSEMAAGREELSSPAEEVFDKMAERLLNMEDEPKVEPEEDEEEEETLEPVAEEENLELEEEPAAAAPKALEPPVSLTAEEKEAFNKLPDEAKAFTARRIGELERAFHAKAQEIATVRDTTQLEYLRYAEALQQDAAARLAHFAEQLKPRVPDARLARTDPASYAHMLSEYHERNAQREQAQRQADMAAQQAKAYHDEQARQHAAIQSMRLQSELPELYDPTTGREKVQTLLATADALGIPHSAIQDVELVKALKATSEWRTKAEKYDRAMSKKNERVVSKKPTPTARPGSPKGPASPSRSVDKAWQLVKESRSGADRDAATAIWLEQAGLI